MTETIFNRPQLEEMLRIRVLNKNATLPNFKALPIDVLVRVINRLRYLELGWGGHISERHNRSRVIADALMTLADLVPTHRTEIVSDGCAEEQDLVCLDSLLSAVRTTLALGLPVASMDIFAPNFARDKRQNNHWRGYADLLQSSFHTCIPGRAKSEGYRFVQCIIPEITSESPTIGNVEQHLKEIEKSKGVEIVQ